MKAIHLILAAIAAPVIVGTTDLDQTGNATVVQTIVHTFTHVQTSVETSIDYSTEYSSITPSDAGTSTPNETTTVYLTNSTTRTISVAASEGTTTTSLFAITATTAIEPPPACTADDNPPSAATTVTVTVYPVPANPTSSTIVSGTIGNGNLSMTYDSSTWTIRPTCNASTTWILTTVTASPVASDGNTISYTPSAGNETGIVVTATATTYTTSSKSTEVYTGGPIFTNSGNAVKAPFFVGLVARFLSLANAFVLPSPLMQHETQTGNESTTFDGGESHFFRHPIPHHAGEFTVSCEVPFDTQFFTHDTQSIGIPSAKPTTPMIAHVIPPKETLARRSTISASDDATITVYQTTRTIYITNFIPVTTTVDITVHSSGILFISTSTVAASSTKTVTAEGNHNHSLPGMSTWGFVIFITVLIFFVGVCCF